MGDVERKPFSDIPPTDPDSVQDLKDALAELWAEVRKPFDRFLDWLER
jgi:hypothetical protein